MNRSGRYLSQHFGVWAMHDSGRVIDALLSRVDLAAHLLREQLPGAIQARKIRRRRFLRAQQARMPIVGRGVISVVDIIGELTKYGSSLADGSALVDVRRQVRTAAASPDVQAIALRIDSPGGSTAGVSDLADDIAAAARSKPVHAYIEDCACSAAYWLASQASRIAASRSAWVGSIGCYTVIYDTSGNYEQKGIKTLVVRSTSYKGIEVPGVPVTDEVLAFWQKVVNEVHAQFVAAVSRGRRMTPAAIEALATGDIWPANEAKQNGLIDEVHSWDRFLTTLNAAKDGKGEIMPYENEEELENEEIEEEAKKAEDVEEEEEEEEEKEKVPAATDKPLRAATITELRAAMPQADAEFLLSCVEAGLSIEQARLMARSVGCGRAPAGSRPLNETSASRAAEVVDDIRAAAHRIREREGISLRSAYSRLARENSEAYQAWLDRQNKVPLRGTADRI